MGHLVLALSVLTPAARATDAAAARALTLVVAAEKRLNQRARQHHQDLRDTSQAAKEAIAAANRLAHGGGNPQDARADAREARQELRDARREAAESQRKYLDAGRGYIAAEDAYHGVTGQYHDERRYDHVREKLRLPPRPGAPPPDVPGPGDPDDAVVQALNDGQITTPEMERRVEQLSVAADTALARALGGGFAAGEPPTRGFNAGTADAGAGASGGGGSARAPAAAAEASLDRAVLLSRPDGDQSAAAAGRILAAGAERLRMGDPRGALEAAEAALKANPRDAKAWAQKAAALNRLRRFAEAEQAAERAVALDPGNARAFRDLAWAQLHLGKADEAVKNATRMIFLDPDNPEGYLLRAFAYEMKGDRARMLADLERAAALDARYANHLARARAGLRLFDPSAADTESLLGALDPVPAAPRNPLVMLGVLFVSLAALAWAALAARARGARRAAPPFGPVPPPPLVGGRFRKGRPAGAGAFGEVWEAVDESLQRAVALEEFPAAVAADPGLRARGLEAARAAGAGGSGGAELYEIVELPSAVVLVWSRPPSPRG